MPKPASLEGMTEEQIRTAAVLYRSIITDPATRDTGLRATKTLFPDLAIPEVDMVDAMKKSDEAREKRLEALETKQLEREAELRIAGQRQALRDRGYSAENVTAIEKIMMDERIASYETATKFFDAQNRVATPTPDSGGIGAPTTFRMPESPLKASRGGRFGLRDWARTEANAALQEIHSGRVKLAA